MKKLFLAMLTFISTQAMAQTLEKMQWFNEPEQWEIADNALSMYVTPHSDYWRIHITDLLSMTLLFITIRMAASLK